MKAQHINNNPAFIGREAERTKLQSLAAEQEAKILIVYGRRRIGKTELLEQTFKSRNILKFEGLESKPQKEQRAHVLWQLAQYAEDIYIEKLQLNTWKEIFMLLVRYVEKGTWTLYFEELQWLAHYQPDFIAELKYVWDNHFRHNPKLLLILCGSSPSFMINQVVKSKALYNRSQYELPLKPFSLAEARQFMPKCSLREVMDAYLSVGGIPEYLKWLKKGSSVFLSLCQYSFEVGGFFSHEHERIFTSSLTGNPHYKKIIAFLSKRRFATRNEILAHLKLRSGGHLSELLADLEICGFIERYHPFNTRSNSLLVRYAIADNYLRFYFKFIKPILSDIDNGDYNGTPTHAIKSDTYYKWLGFAFEHLCRQQHRLIAKILGFSAVKYRSGAYFKRGSTTEKPGLQIDLLFERDDHVLTICEIKYLRQPVGTKVIAEFERKLALLPENHRLTKHKVLISAEGADKALINSGYFDQIISLDTLFNY